MTLGRLTRVDLRHAWAGEASAFTPWLARAENLVLLADTLGLDLELEAQERSVGPFRADILARDSADGSWVLIENQLERTDHGHLGQLITYAAGLQAVTIVWIAARFAEEHRAALDWLNEVTAEDIRFFGIEIELWQIGDSRPAPRFNLVAKPNDWSKSVAAARRSVAASALGQLQQRYWTALLGHLAATGTRLRLRAARPGRAHSFAIGRAGCRITASISTSQKWLRADLLLEGPQAIGRFETLGRDRAEIDAALGPGFDWLVMDQGTRARIASHLRETDPADEADWPRQHAWFADRLERLHGVFAPRLAPPIEPAPGRDDIEDAP